MVVMNPDKKVSIPVDKLVELRRAREHRDRLAYQLGVAAIAFERQKIKTMAALLTSENMTELTMRELVTKAGHDPHGNWSLDEKEGCLRGL